MLERHLLGSHPGRPPGQQPGGVDPGRDVGERERDALVVDDRGSEGLTLTGVLRGVLERGASDPERLRGHHRPGLLERAEGVRPARPLCPRALLGVGRRFLVRSFRCLPALGRQRLLARLGQLVLELVGPAQEVPGRDAYAVEAELRGVRGPAAQLVQLPHQLETGRAAGHDEHRLAAVAEVGVDGGGHDVHVGDPAVADPHLVAVDHPVVAVATRRGPQVADVAAALGLRDRQRRELEVTRLAEALRRPLEHLLRSRGLADRGQRECRHHDREADARAAPEQLLHEQRQAQPGRVADEVAVEQRVVEPLLRGLLEHGPGELLLLVVLRGDRAYDVACERVRPLHEVVLGRSEGQVERHGASVGVAGARPPSLRDCPPVGADGTVVHVTSGRWGARRSGAGTPAECPRRAGRPALRRGWPGERTGQSSGIPGSRTRRSNVSP